MLVSGGDNATITRRMFNSLRDQLDPTIAAISTCLIVVSVAALIGRRKDHTRCAAGQVSPTATRILRAASRTASR